MGAFDSRLQRLEDRLQVPGTRTRAQEIALQELIVSACYGVRAAADRIEASGQWTGPEFDRFAHNAEVQLIRQQKRLRELTQDDDAAWEARLVRIESEAQVPRRRRARTAA